MINDALIKAINEGVREHYGIAPKYIAMNRKSFEQLNDEIKNDRETIGIEKHCFFGIQIRIVNITKDFELCYFVDPINKDKI